MPKEKLDYVINSRVTVSELIKKLQSLPEEFKDAIVYVGEQNGSDGTYSELNNLWMADEDQDEDGGEIPKTVYLENLSE